MAYGTVNADVIGTSVAGSNLGAGNASIMKNRIINGSCVIDQRNAGASVTPASGNTYTLDRWYSSNTVGSKYSVQQNAGSVTPPAGFSNYLGCTSLSAYSVGASENYLVIQKIEGFNTSDLMWGTASAKTITLSFQVYSSLTGTFGGAINNSAFNRSYPFSYSIPVANTWTTISVTIAGDTTGTWIGATNGTGLVVAFSLGTGTTLSTTAGAWASGTYVSATGATSVVGTSGATFYITGVQLEVGSSATGFEYRQYQQELALCQRYFQWIPFGIGFTSYAAGQFMQVDVPFQVVMRTVPSFATISADPNAAQTVANNSANGFTAAYSTTNAALASLNATSTGTCQVIGYRSATSAEL